MSTPSMPTPPSVSRQYAKTLDTQLKYAPALYEASAQYQPLYADLAAQQYNTFLQGITPTYTQDVLPQLRQSATDTRSQNIADVNNLGPLSQLAIRNSSPEAAAMVDKLMRQGNEGLDAGRQLAGDDLRNLNSSLRSSMGARGVSYGPAASYAEAMAASDYGNQLYQQRQSNALSALGSYQNLYGDSFNRVLGTPDATVGTLGQLGAQVGQGIGQSGPSLFNPNANENFYSGVYANQSQMAAANAAATGNMTGALIGAAAPKT